MGVGAMVVGGVASIWRVRGGLYSALGELCAGDCGDFGYDFDEDIEPVYVKLGDEPDRGDEPMT